MPPTVPINHYDGPRNQQNRTKRPILLFHANIFEQYACFEHSNFFKVKVLVRQEPQGLKVSQKERPRWKSSTRKNRTGQPGPKFNYELFNCNNFNNGASSFCGLDPVSSFRSEIRSLLPLSFFPVRDTIRRTTSTRAITITVISRVRNRL